MTYMATNDDDDGRPTAGLGKAFTRPGSNDDDDDNDDTIGIK